jgi:stage II sporulation protein D
MQKSQPRHSKYFFGAFLILFFLTGRPTEFGQENSFFYGFLIKNPVIRVGLGVNLDEAAIRASSGMKIYEVGPSYRVLAEDVNDIHVKGRKEKLTEKFVLQVAETEKKEEAERLALQLRSKIDQKVYVTAVRESKSDESYQVRVGDFLTRGEALGFIKKLNQAGIKEAWILQEEVTEEESHPLWVLVNDELKTLNKETVIYFVPSNPESYLSYDGNSYRGILVLRASRKGLVLVNILNLENYLKGVVPCELSPDKFNAYEALKAQAVAARTYAVKNLGRNEDLGFDLCDTPACQVYGGLSAEHPLSSRAVEETKGEVASYKGKLINALYTSTCGGMTEDIENVFGGKAQPYLKSTECIYEKQKEWVLESQKLLPVLMNGRNIEREVALLVSLNVIAPKTDPSYYRETAAFEEAVEWIKRAIVYLGKRNGSFVPEKTVMNFPNLASLFISSFQWGDRVKNLMLKSEVDFLLKDFPPLRGDVRGNLAYLIHSGIFFSSPQMADEARLITRAELVFILYKTVRSYFDPSHRGVFRSLTKNELEVEENGETRTLSLSPDVFLFRNQDDESFPASRLTLLGGEEVRWVENQGQIRLLDVFFASNTNVLDRSSSFYRWQVRQSCVELEKRINDYYPIGRLVDIAVQERGKSHRVTELLITGTETQAIVKGLKIRWVLGLRDTLFTLDKEYGDGEQVTYFIFTGKGWGHGVGLCQVGAFRMAQAGAGYKDILKKYYQDIKITKID